MGRDLLKEFQAAYAKDAPWGSEFMFLDSITSVEELRTLNAAVLGQGQEIKFFDHYEKTLTRWPNPKLPDDFAQRFPLVAARLDTPEKIRVLLRGADFMRVSLDTMASVFETIIHRHDVDGQEIVTFEDDRNDEWCRAARIVYYTQIQAWALKRLLLPGSTSSGMSTKRGLYIDWRPEERQNERPTLANRPHGTIVAQGTDINGLAMVHCQRCGTTAHAVDEATARADLAKIVCAYDCMDCSRLRRSNSGRTEVLYTCLNDGNRWWQSNTHYRLWQQVTSDTVWGLLCRQTPSYRT